MFNKSLEHAVIPLQSFPSVLPAASLRSLRGRLRVWVSQTDRCVIRWTSLTSAAATAELTSLSDRLCPRSAASVPFCLCPPFSPTPSLWCPCPRFPRVSCLHPLTCSHFGTFCFDVALLLFLKELRVGSFPTWSAPAAASQTASAHMARKSKWKDAVWGCSTKASRYVIKNSAQTSDKKHQWAVITPRNACMKQVRKPCCYRKLTVGFISEPFCKAFKERK